MISSSRVKTLYRNDAPFKPYTVDICLNACYAFQPNAEEDLCPVCFIERYQEDSKTPQRTIRMLPIAPQLATLFTNPSFLAHLNDSNSIIENTFKGNTIQTLKNDIGLFKSKYDIGLSLFLDAFQSHKRGGVKLNIVMLQILNLPQNVR